MFVLLGLVKFIRHDSKRLDSAAFGITWLPALSNFLPLHVKETINTEKYIKTCARDHYQNVFQKISVLRDSHGF